MEERKVIKTETFYQVWEMNEGVIICELNLEVCKENDYRAWRVFNDEVQNYIHNNDILSNTRNYIFALEKVTFEFYDDYDYEEIETERMNTIKMNVE